MHHLRVLATLLLVVVINAPLSSAALGAESDTAKAGHCVALFEQICQLRKNEYACSQACKSHIPETGKPSWDMGANVACSNKCYPYGQSEPEVIVVRRECVGFRYGCDDSGHAVATAELERRYTEEVRRRSSESQARGTRSAGEKLDALRYLLDQIVAEDSTKWFNNRYIRNSMFDVKKVSESGNVVVVRGSYEYHPGAVNDRETGWVEVTFVDNLPSCLRYFDQQNTCRRLN
jgi:hypothetical protein